MGLEALGFGFFWGGAGGIGLCSFFLWVFLGVCLIEEFQFLMYKIT